MSQRAGRLLVAQAVLASGAASMVVLLVGCSESTAKPTVRGQEGPLASASAPVVAATEAAPATAAAAETIEDMRGKRPVDPAHQRCTSDGDCDAVRADCSNLRCVGVRKEFARSYAGLECKGYKGPVGNYDCQPSFHIEEPRCEAGKCLSRRITR